MTPAPSVPNRHASGTFFLGFSTASEFCAADSMPRNAHKVSEMLDPIPAPTVIPCGFHADENVAPLYQNRPMTESRPTGRVTPQTVMEPIRPVTDGPAKLANVVSESSTITPRQVAIGADESHGTNAER